MLGVINTMLAEMMAAIARKDYDQRRERQVQGIEKVNIRGARSMPICTSG